MAAVAVVALPTAAHADLLGSLLGQSGTLCVVNNVLNLDVNGGTGTCSSGTAVSVLDITGPKGDTGSTGPQGTQGASGAQGAQGPQGVKGDPGAAGPAGPKGANGTNGVSGYHVVSKQQTLKAGQAMTWTMSCGTGKATGGGVRSTSAGSFLMQGSGPSSASGSGWSVTMVNVSKKSHKITGYAMCASV
jgi:hypothetical protein